MAAPMTNSCGRGERERRRARAYLRGDDGAKGAGGGPRGGGGGEEGGGERERHGVWPSCLARSCDGTRDDGGAAGTRGCYWDSRRLGLRPCGELLHGSRIRSGWILGDRIVHVDWRSVDLSIFPAKCLSLFRQANERKMKC
ncbi:hypothetical protein EJB05_51985, partial [Eragrostis curvula]